MGQELVLKDCGLYALHTPDCLSIGTQDASAEMADDDAKALRDWLCDIYGVPEAE